MIPEGSSTQVNVKVPDNLLALIDKIVVEKGYRNRQDFFLEAARHLVQHHEGAGNGIVKDEKEEAI